jgi:ribosomal protein S27E
MALMRILDWSSTAPKLPPREMKPWPHGAQIRRDGEFGRIEHCDDCGVPLTVFGGSSGRVLCGECAEY